MATEKQGQVNVDDLITRGDKDKHYTFLAGWSWSKVDQDVPDIPDEGWKLHVSGNNWNAADLYRLVLPVLWKNKIAHKALFDYDHIKSQTDEQEGKILVVYPSNIQHAFEIVTMIDIVLKKAGWTQYNSPCILHERWVGETVIYTRYGAFNEMIYHPGKKEYAKDSRGSIKPDWIVDPWGYYPNGDAPKQNHVPEWPEHNERGRAGRRGGRRGGGAPHAVALAVPKTEEEEKKSDDLDQGDSEKHAPENALLESDNKNVTDEGLEQLPVASRRSLWQQDQKKLVTSDDPGEPFIDRVSDQVYTKVRSRLLQDGKEVPNVHASKYGAQPPVVDQPFPAVLDTSVHPPLPKNSQALRIATAEATEGGDTAETFPGDKKDVSIIDQIYEKVKELFQPSQNQELQMEFPGRVLNEDKFKYDTKSVYSTVTKPRPVAEQEFLLSNDMYGSSKLSGGPNGKHLSSSYQTALNMLIPKMSNLDTVYQDRQKLRDWLNTEVVDEVDGEDFKGSRMALYQKLLKRYEEAKETWEKTRVRKLKKATASGNPKDMEDYAVWLANEGEPNLKKLESYFDDLVVRGFYHEVRDFISYLDVCSPTAALKEAKDSMRASASMSLDESQTIYPVQMQPNNWSEGLSTDFKPVDLCMDPEFIKLQLMQKMKELQTLQSKVQKLRSVSTGDPKQLQAEVEQAQNALDDAHLEALNNFTDAALEAAKLAYEAYQNKHTEKDSDTALNDFTELGKQPSGGEDDPNVAIKAQTGSSFSEEDFEKFAEFQEKALKNQVKLEQANRRLAFMMEAKAQAEATSTDQARLDIEKQIKIAKLDIKNLKELAYAKGSTTTAMSVQATDDVSSIPDSPPVDHFMDVVMKFDASSTRSKSKLSSSAETNQSTAALLFGSVGTSSGSSTGDFNEENFSSASSIEIGFRATKVTIQRGGWFQPELFDASTDMYRMGDGKFNDIFPNYPTAFVIVKDVTIKVKMDSHESGTASEYLNKQSSKSGGFLCFGASSSSSSSSNSHSSYSGVTSDGIIIRIPGPQILFWVLENVATDKSQMYPADQSVIPDTLLNPTPPERQLADSADSRDT